MAKRKNTVATENQNEIFANCRLKFTALPKYGHAIYIIDGVQYDLYVDKSTEVDRAHLEELKSKEPNLFVED